MIYSVHILLQILFCCVTDLNDVLRFPRKIAFAMLSDTYGVEVSMDIAIVMCSIVRIGNIISLAARIVL